MLVVQGEIVSTEVYETTVRHESDTRSLLSVTTPYGTFVFLHQLHHLSRDDVSYEGEFIHQ